MEKEEKKEMVYSALYLDWCTIIYAIKNEKVKRKWKSESRTRHLLEVVRQAHQPNELQRTPRPFLSFEIYKQNTICIVQIYYNLHQSIRLL